MTDRRLRWLGTVRWRVTLLAAITVAFVLVAAGVVLVIAQRTVLIDQLDEALTADAARLTASAELSAADLDPDADDEAVAQLVALDGTVLMSSPGLWTTTALADVPPPGTVAFATVKGPDGADASFRVSSQRSEIDGEDLIVHVAAPLDDVDDAVSALLVALGVAGPAVVALLAAVVWWLAGRTLRPVEALRTELASIGPRQLGRRVPQPAGSDEIARLAATMNEMLQRLDESNRQQQRFVADASHELRTPLARLQAEIEVTRAEATRAPPPAGVTVGHDDLLESIGSEIDGLRRLTEDLLVLARRDGGALEPPGRPVDLDDLVFEEVRALGEPRVAVDTSRVSAAQVIGQRDHLRRVVANLLDNALRHAVTVVTITLSENGTEILLTVTDDGPGIPPDQRSEVFERFRRLDDARSTDRGGTGLGLAIVKDLVEHHRGRVSVDPQHVGGARLIVTMPTTGVAFRPRE